MAGKNKLKRFEDLATFPNVYQNHNVQAPSLTASTGETLDLKGQWNKLHFKNDNPIVLELACGKGEYTVGMAAQYPDKNFIGVDIKGNRIWVGAHKALETQQDNVAFLRTRIEQLGLFFGEKEISEIWITFPDPYLRKGKARKRLTSPQFLERYRPILKEGGLVHLKTDEGSLSDFTLEVIEEDPRHTLLYYSEDIYAAPLAYPELELKTYYEKMHLAEGKTIKYLRFTIHGA